MSVAQPYEGNRGGRGDAIVGRFGGRAAIGQQLAGMFNLAGVEGRAAAELHASRLGRLAAVPGAVDD